jgi:phosphoenolpyruvate carboxykinase (GTP)
MRVLKWVIDRAHGRVGAQETAIGWVPRTTDLDLAGLGVKEADVEAARRIDRDEWRAELASLDEWFDNLGPTLPRALRLQRDLLLERL